MDKLIQKVSGWPDLQREMGPEQTKLPFENPVTDTQQACNAHFRIMCAVEFFKQGEKCTYKQGNNQLKFFAWMSWDKLKARWGFSYAGTYYDYTYTVVGPRLCSLKKEYAIHIANVVCKDDYEKYFNE